MNYFPNSITVREVGLRDGLQSIPTVVSTPDKIRWLNAAYKAGLRHIEIGSYVPVHLMPQLADTQELMDYSKTLPGLATSVLVPNLRGALAALDSGADYLMMPLSASYAHSLANLRKTPDEVVAEVGRIRAARDSSGSRMLIDGGVGTAFGCTLQGPVPLSEVVRLTEALLDAGADRISIADTVGFADPAAVERVLEQVVKVGGERIWSGHFHDTRGLGLANVVASMPFGIRRFDACIAGIGGCPHAPHSGGNIATEDLVFMLESMGISTGIDINGLFDWRQIVSDTLPEERLYGRISQAGLPNIFHLTPTSGASV